MVRRVNKRVLILCEDRKSSKTYFQSFKKDEKLKRNLSAVKIEIYQPHDFSPLGLVNEAIAKQKQAKREQNSYDEIWVVLDRDSHANLPDAYGLAINKKINFGLSVVCFEYWILLHYEKTRHGFYNCDDVISYLKKHHCKSYKKGVIPFEELKIRIPEAINNGRWLDKQIQPDLDSGTKPFELSAYTHLHLLVQKLFDPKHFLT